MRGYGVISGTILLGALVGACPRLSALATSRAALRVRGEREVPLLPLPVSDRRLSVAELAHVPSVALFLEHAAASQPTFALSTDNAATVAVICRLDGLPRLAGGRLPLWVLVLNGIIWFHTRIAPQQPMAAA